MTLDLKQRTLAGPLCNQSCALTLPVCLSLSQTVLLSVVSLYLHALCYLRNMRCSSVVETWTCCFLVAAGSQGPPAIGLHVTIPIKMVKFIGASQLWFILAQDVMLSKDVTFFLFSSSFCFLVSQTLYASYSTVFLVPSILVRLKYN